MSEVVPHACPQLLSAAAHVSARRTIAAQECFIVLEKKSFGKM
jgi:hypothetical protein